MKLFANCMAYGNTTLSVSVVESRETSGIFNPDHGKTPLSLVLTPADAMDLVDAIEEALKGMGWGRE